MFFIKKSQVSLFIIIGILLVIIVSFVFFLANDFSGKGIEEQRVDISDQGIKMHIQNCLDKNANNMVSLLAFQGGYISILDDSFVYDINNVYFYINYAYNAGKRLVSKPVIEEELKFYINSAFSDCIDFSVFEEQGYEIDYSPANTNVIVNENNVGVEVEFPVIVSQGGEKQQFDEKYYSIVNARLGYVHDSVGKIVEDLSDKPEYIHTSFLYDFDVVFDVLRLDENTYVYTIIDEKSDIDGMPLVYMFGVKK